MGPTIYIQCGFREPLTGVLIPRARVIVRKGGVIVEFMVGDDKDHSTESVCMKEAWRKLVWDGQAWKLSALDTLISWAYESMLKARREDRRAAGKDGK